MTLILIDIKLINLADYLPSIPTFSYNDRYTVTNGTVDSLPGMLFSTTPFTFDSINGVGYTPYNGDAVALAMHGMTPPEPASLLLIGLGGLFLRKRK